jgi:hypothetical protein
MSQITGEGDQPFHPYGMGYFSSGLMSFSLFTNSIKEMLNLMAVILGPNVSFLEP